MQAIYRSSGDAIPHTPANALPAGRVVVLPGGRLGIARSPIPANVAGTLYLGPGLYDVVKVAGAISAGAALFWDAAGNPQGGAPGSGACTTSADGRPFLGVAAESAEATAARVSAYLLPAPSPNVTVYEDMSAIIADPGAGGAIAPLSSGTCLMTSAAAETRTLPIPAFAGQKLALVLNVRVGNVVVTATQAINQTGNTVMTFDAAGDTIELIGVRVSTALRWRVAGNDGVTLSGP